MNTEHLFLYFGLLFYMIFNVVSDVKHLKTYNLWHLMFFIGLFLYGVYEDVYIQLLITVIISLTFGILIGNIQKASFGAGDKKMIVVCSMFLVLMYVEKSILESVFVFVSVYFLLSFFIFCVSKYIQKKMILPQFKVGTYSITKTYIVVPEAIPIFLACVTTFTW